MYSDSENDIKKDKINYSTMFRNIIGCKRDTVTMLLEDPSTGLESSQSLCTLGKIPSKDGDKIDLGPDGYHFPFEVQLIDRTFTLYASNRKKMDEFCNYIE